MEENETRTLYNAFLTARKMVSKRGLKVEPIEWSTSFPKFKSHLLSSQVDGDEESQRSCLNFSSQNALFVFFGEDTKLSTAELNKYVSHPSTPNTD